MGFKLSDNKVIIGLIFALVVQILILFWHMGWIPHFSAEKISEGKVAGYIDRLDNTLKKRPINNLIWNRTDEKEKVFFHDSLLTLSQSQATVHLDNGTEIQLSENTLITIEPPSKESPEEIKIQFSKGHLQARNPFKKSQIKDEQMTLTLKKDSQVDFSKNEKGDYEVVVKKGEAQVQTGGNNQALQENQILTFSKDKKLETARIDPRLNWRTSEKTRGYTHEEKASVTLTWTGEARELVVKNKTGVFSRRNLTSSNQKIDLNLPLGDYRAFLQNENLQSVRKGIEIRKAPVIHLLSPRPRDRVRTGHVSFQWEDSENLKAYELHIDGDEIEKKIEVGEAQHSLLLEREDFVDWRVWGIDEEGFKIPPPYSYPLYIRKNLFAPPKTKKIKKVPKRKGAWFHWLIPQAYAQTPKIALLTWEPIEFADLYTIEISKSKTFRELVHKVEISKNRYEFKEAKRDQTYYWRVAAGDRRGNMGAFSEPTRLTWVSAEPSQSKPDQNRPRKTFTKKRPAKPIKKQKPAPSKTTKKSQPKKQEIPLVGEEKKDENFDSKKYLKSVYLAYSPHFGIKYYNMPLNTKTNIQGTTPLAFTVQFNFLLTSNFDSYFLGKYDQSEYQPTIESPFQKNINSQRIQGVFGFESNKNRWGLAAYVANLPISSRVGFEEITLNQTLAYGALGSYHSEIFGFDYLGLLGPSFTDTFVGAYTSHRFLHPLFTDSMKIGIELEGYYHTEGSQNSSLLNFNLHLGWEF